MRFSTHLVVALSLVACCGCTAQRIGIANGGLDAQVLATRPVAFPRPQHPTYTQEHPVNLRPQVLENAHPMASQRALALKEELDQSKLKTKEIEKRFKMQEAYVLSLNQRLLKKDEAYALLQKEVVQLETRNQLLNSKLGVAQTELQELRDQTDKTLNEIENNLNQFLLQAMSKMNKKPTPIRNAGY